MNDTTYLARARRKTVTAEAPRELLHTMAAAADAGAPQGSASHWCQQLPAQTLTQTTKALERLIQAGHAAKEWDPDRCAWVYQITL